ncbi:PREDICTED: uncharacterized protein LOC104813668 [Tarenaya hassleriana]|uniref:uncharacterized protein LOC104813668 n=1 Tax=Tarenaya hassleriana TaxID=28532 RepID=UPI00053C2D8B|nr:PREDICTED: uncharacterized protein LOC104813668 [Tarenaya hassleriana]
MGCGGSKVDDQPLVILCRERKDFIKAASNHRVALAAAHLAYFQSLHDVGEAIRRFVDEELVVGSSSSPDSPVLTLPSDEGKPRKPKISSSSTSISHSVIEEGEEDEDEENTEDSHLHLSSGSESGSEAGSDPSEGHIHIESSPEPEGHIHYRPPESFPHGYPPVYPPLYSPGYSSGYPYPPGDWGFMGGNPDPNPNSYPGMYYMKKSAAPSRSVVFQPENHRVENGQWPSDPGFGYPGYYPGNPRSGFFGYPPSSGDFAEVPRSSPAPAPPPPAPPAPPSVSAWDYLNVFDMYDYSGGGAGYSGLHPPSNAVAGSNSSSPDSREVREREGIPDLEEETEQEVIKEAYKYTKKTKTKKKKEVESVTEQRHDHDHAHDNPKIEEIRERSINGRGNSGEGTSRAVPMPRSATESSSSTVSSFSNSDVGHEFHHVNGGEGKGSNSSSGHGTVMTKSSEEAEEEIGRKKGVSFELEETTTTSFDVESSKISSLTTLSVHGTRDLREVVKEIKNEFEVASSYGKEVAVLLEVSKLPYQRKNNGFKVIFSRIMYLVAPSMLQTRSRPQPSVRLTSRTLKMAKSYNGEEPGGFTCNLSSTLEKLYAWEKKLYKEVKDEEKLRVIYEEKCKTLKKLDSHGAESSKIDATRASIRKLLTKIDVCIRSVDSISSRIHKLRDEELQPQLTQLIHGLIKMWRSMLKCHQKQFQAIMESKVRSLRANTGLQRDSGLKAILDLEMELREWCNSFNDWVNTQKLYAESLNGWLSRCLHYEPEATDDGIAPFSPSRLGAPPVFVICNDWQDAMARISGENVTNAMQGFASSLRELWERQDEEQRQRVKAEYVSHDFEKRLNDLRTERARARMKADEEERDEASGKSVVSTGGRSGSGISALDDLKVDLDSMRKKLEQERERHKEAIKLVNNAASTSLQAGLIPIFEALGNFTSEVVKAHEHVRLQYPRAS